MRGRVAMAIGMLRVDEMISTAATRVVTRSRYARRATRMFCCSCHTSVMRMMQKRVLFRASAR